MHHRAETVAHRISHDAVDLRGLGEGIEAVHLPHLSPADLAGCEHAVFVERREGERGSGPAGQDPGRHADVAHADADGGNAGRMHHLQHPQIVGRMICHRGNLDDVGIEFGEPLVQEHEVGGCFLEVVVTHDPLRLAIPRHLGGDVVLEIDVVGPLDDRRAEEHEAGLFGLLPAAAVGDPAAGHDDRAGPLRKEPFRLHRALEVIEPQFDEWHAVLREMAVLCNDVSMPASADADADHGCRRPPFTFAETGGRVRVATASATSAVRAGNGATHGRAAGRGRGHRPPAGRAGRPL